MDRQRQGAPGGDPFAGEFSQARVAPALASWPVLQWHGGIASAVVSPNGRSGRTQPGSGLDGASSSASGPVRTHGGFFIEDERVADLGLDPAEPVAGFESEALHLGGRPISGWSAPLLHLAFIFSDFSWEDRESGRTRFPAGEYERRRRAAPGTERELRGRTRCLVAVRELLEAGVVEPVLLSVRGTYSAALNAILRDARRMADEATRLRRKAGYEGGVPREAFWVPVFRGMMEAVGEGSNTSRVSLPKSDVPAELTRDILVRHLVDERDRRPGGTFDQWAELYREAWEERVLQGMAATDDSLPPAPEYEYEM